jgi:hypothetical protein
MFRGSRRLIVKTRLFEATSQSYGAGFLLAREKSRQARG